MIRPMLRRLWAPVAIVTALGLIAVLPGVGLGKATPTLWSVRPANAPAVTRPAPAWVQLAKELKPAVVNISTKRVQESGPDTSQLPDDPQFREFFKQFFGGQQRRTVHSLGSGFIVNADGYIVTNNHVVDGASDVRVKLADGREMPAKVLGHDAKTDLALVKVDAKNLPVIPLGDSSQLQVGEPVMAIGNPFGLEQTVTTGIVSATGRVIGEGPYDDFIQTDASINPGNSGGPLINDRGEAVGINAAIVSQSGGSVGIGFAIPVNLAKPVVAQLATSGHVTRGYLGVGIQSLTPELAKTFGIADGHGALVASVVPESPAAKAGVKAGDVITEYNGRKIAKSDELPRVVAATPTGKQVSVTVLRDGKPVTLDVRVAALPDEQPRQEAKAEQGGLGLSVQNITPDLASQLHTKAPGVVVRGVKDGSKAASAGFQPGDVIAEVDHHPVKNVQDMTQALAKHRAGSPTLFLVQRGGQSLFLAVAA